MDSKKLYRSKTNRMVSGVIGGVSEYLEVDATILRLGYALLAVFTAVVPAALVYILAIFIVPEGENTKA